MTEIGTLIGGLLLLATLVEGTITYLSGESAPYKRPYLRYISLVFGILVSVLYRVDILATLGLFGVSPYVGYFMTGIIVGRGSNYLNDIITLIKAKKASL